jgi:SNF2 family DNA or RNA helicase
MEFNEKSSTTEPSTATTAALGHEASNSADLASQFGGSALEELKLLGVQTFQASELENTVVQQMDQQLEHEAAYRGSRELNKTKADLENLKTQISRLRAQCNRLRQQDRTDTEVDKLYKECVRAYRKRKVERDEMEARVNQLKADLDRRVDEARAIRLQREKERPEPLGFDLGMRMTTTDEQESLLQATRQAHARSTASSSMEGVSNAPQPASNEAEDDTEALIDPTKSSRKRPAPAPSSESDHEDDRAISDSNKRTFFGADTTSDMDAAETEIPPRNASAPPATNQAQRRGRSKRKDEDDEDYDVDLEDEVDAILEELQEPKDDNEANIDDEPNVGSQRVRRTDLGDRGDELHGRYLDRVEKWIDEHKEDPRSREIRRLRKWVNAKQKQASGFRTLSPQEQKILTGPVPIRKASVSKNDDISTTKFEGGYEIPKHMYRKLFEHQRVAIRWLWELHQQEAGGILGDEMGLGKTLETIAFLSGLAHSGLLAGPILIVCPTTVVSHWLREFHWWAPEFSVLTYRGSGESVPISPTLEQCASVFEQPNGFTKLYDDLFTETEKMLQTLKKHASRKAVASSTTTRKASRGSKKTPRYGSSEIFADEDKDVDIDGDFFGADLTEESDKPVEELVSDNANVLLDQVLGEERRFKKPQLDEDEQALIDRVDGRTPVVLIVSYETVRMNISALSRVHWHYAIMDEGHKLRNPEAAVTQACKRLPTPHRILLSGTPIQNNLVELWSLFDFCFPGKLGTLETFEQHFAWPIQRGGYANASPMEVRVAYKCAVTLRDLVNPYLLRRSKDQVNIKLPEKSEQILFCQLTTKQREAYKAFLRSSEASAVYEGLKNMLFGVDILRKICNHTFLHEPDHGVSALSRVKSMEDLTEGSAKLKVLNHILAQWKQQGHRVLIFAQTVQMLNIIEAFITRADYVYLRMDGQTASTQRQKLVDRFNEADPNDPSTPFIFLLTTRVGGLGINLTSANRVIVYDPDWNPMTDLQAKERAYRIGQTSSVIVYRLVTSGTIEEKIYHRQVFKQFLTQKILRDPKQTRSFFQSSGLKELFKLSEKAGALHEDALTQVPRDEMVESDEDEKDKKDQDGWLLDGLMGQEIAAKVDHEAVIDSATGHRGKGRAVEAFVEQEAENLASKAVDMLRRSRSSSGALSSTSQSARVSGGAIPKFGTVSRKAASGLAGSSLPQTPKVSGLGASTAKTGLSGSEIVQSLKENSVHPLVETQAHLVRIKDFFLKLGGSASSQQIADWFRDKVPQSQLLLFRSLLRKIADFHADTRYWKLRAWAGGEMPEGQVLQ